MANLEHQRKYLQKFNDKFKIFKTEEDINIAIQLYNEGKTTKEIGKIFGCSKVPVEKVLKQSGIVFRKAHEYSSHRSKNQFGKNNPNWKGGIKSIYDRFRGLLRYWSWHNDILIRDENKCVNCNSIENLEVHHKTTLKTLVVRYSIEKNKDIKDFTENDLLSDYFYDIANGVTYCKKCHKDWHKIHGR